MVESYNRPYTVWACHLKEVEGSILVVPGEALVQVLLQVGGYIEKYVVK